ncbi:MAG: TIGR03013 family XrtA/PEP-CTERM system glycosyltransferase [bacterium]
MLNYIEKHFSRIWLLVFSVDFLILLLTAIVPVKIMNSLSLDTGNLRLIYLRHHFLVTFVLLSQITLFINELYNTEKKYEKNLLIFKCIVSFMFVSLGCYLLSVNFFSYYNCFVISMIACFLILCWRFIFYMIIPKVNIQQKILFLGTDELSKKVVREILADDHPKYKVAGFIGNDPESVGKSIVNPKVLGLVEDLDSITQKEKIKKVIVSCQQARGTFPSKDLVKWRFKGIEVMELHTFYEHLKGKILLEGLRPSWLIFSRGFKKTKLIKFVKRIFDIMLSIIGLLLSLPISLITALLIKLDSKGPVIFKQERVGEDGKVFNLLKFRSMKTDAEKHTGPVWAEENDPRITPIGRIIRKLRIDEIPQMINVLKGDMSFVGPRPERPYFVDMLSQEIQYYDQRHSVKPGITGWAAVNYRYGASIEDAVEKLQYDLYYIKNISLFLDIITILKTIAIIFGRKYAR